MGGKKGPSGVGLFSVISPRHGHAPKKQRSPKSQAQPVEVEEVDAEAEPAPKGGCSCFGR